MKKIISAVLLTTLVFSFSACGKKEKEAVKTSQSTAVAVTVSPAESMTIENNVTYTGEIKAAETTSVSAKVSGAAVTVYKEVGDYVNAGDILLKIDETDYRTQYNSVMASLNQAKAAYNAAVAGYNSAVNGSAEQAKLQLESALSAAKIEYDNAKTNYDNMKTLYDSGAISKASFDAAKTRLDNATLQLNSAQNNYDLTTGVVLVENATSAKAQVETANAAVLSAQAGLEAVENSIKNTVVRAPISGYIASRNANKGQMVAPGVEIFSIKSTKTIDAKINVTESIIPFVAVGTKAVIAVKAADVSDIEGTVTSVSPTKNLATGMYEVCVAINNDSGVLKDGMFADIKLTLDASVDTLTVLSEAVMEDESGTKYVFVAQGDKAVRKDVKTGIVSEEYTEITEGLSEKEQVIVSGKEYLSEKNNEIRIVK